MKNYQVAVIVGSLRQNSFNRLLAQGIIKLLPKNINTCFIEINNLPLYNEEQDSDIPTHVIEFKKKIEESQGVIFVTPEYNRSIPGALKNALDQGSRPWGKSSWNKKVAGVIGVSVGATGSALAQQHLRNVLSFLDMYTLNQPEAFIKWSDGLVDEEGNIAEISLGFIQQWVDAYVDLLNKLG